MKYHVTIGDRTHLVEVDGDTVALDGRPVEARLARLDGTHVRALTVDRATHRVVAHSSDAETWSLVLEGEALDVSVVDERTRVIREMSGAAGGAGRAAAIRAPMPGLVLKVAVEEGEAVEPGQGVVIVEAMKMENELTAETAARVTAVRVSPGQTVEKGQVLVELESADG